MTCVHGLAPVQMGDLYASAIATTVLQIKEVPTRPAECDGALCVFLLRDREGAVLDVDENTLRAALAKHGEIMRIELTGTLRARHGGVLVRFATHEAALAAKRAGPVAGVCVGVDTLYNERPYDERGWCVRYARAPRLFFSRAPPSPLPSRPLAASRMAGAASRTG